MFCFVEPSKWSQKVIQMLFSGSSSDTRGTSTGMRINRSGVTRSDFFITLDAFNNMNRPLQRPSPLKKGRGAGGG